MSPLMISVIIALLTFLLQNPENEADRKKALLMAGAAGLGTYYVATETEWGQATFGNNATTNPGSQTATGKTDPDGNPLKVDTGGLGSWIKENPGVVAGVAGAAVGAVAAGGLSKYLPWILGGAVLLLASGGQR